MLKNINLSILTEVNRIKKFYIYATYNNEQTLFFGANEKRTTFNFTMKAIDVFCDSMFATNSMQQ